MADNTMAYKKSNPRLTNSSTSGDASKVLEQRRGMTSDQRSAEMQGMKDRVSGKKKSKGPLGSRKKLSGPRNKSQEQAPSRPDPVNAEAYGGYIDKTTNLPYDDSAQGRSERLIREQNAGMRDDYGYQTPNYESYGMDDFTADTSPAEPMAYKKSSCTYKLPGEGSRGAIPKAGGFNANSRAMQAGLIVDGGFGDLSSVYKGSSPAKMPIPISPEVISAAGKMASEAGEGGGGKKPESREGRKVSSGYVENTNVAKGVFDGNKLQ